MVLLSVDMLESVPGGPSGGSGILVRLRDPEAQRKIDRELQTADRLAAISRISSGVAHEVKNPLNAMLLHVEVARAQTRARRYRCGASRWRSSPARSCGWIAWCARSWISRGRWNSSWPTFRCRNWCRRSWNWRGRRPRPPGFGVTVQEEAEGVEVRVDRDLFKQAVLNIVVNAMQAMPEGGELRFEATAGESTAEMRISDTGAGISRGIAREDLPAVFQHQEGRLRNRPGHDLPDRPITRWYNRFHQRTGEGHDLPDPPADRGVTMKMMRGIH